MSERPPHDYSYSGGGGGGGYSQRDGAYGRGESQGYPGYPQRSGNGQSGRGYGDRDPGYDQSYPPARGVGTGGSYGYPREETSYSNRGNYHAGAPRDDYSRESDRRVQQYETGTYPSGGGDPRPAYDAPEHRRSAHSGNLPEQVLERKGGHDQFNTWRLAGDRIHRHVIQKDLCAYLGNDATMMTRDTAEGKFYFITAYRPFSEAQLRDLIVSSERYGQNPTSFASRDPQRQQEINSRRLQEDNENASQISSEVSAESDSAYRFASGGGQPGYGYSSETRSHHTGGGGPGASGPRGPFDRYYGDPGYYQPPERTQGDSERRIRERELNRDSSGLRGYEHEGPSGGAPHYEQAGYPPTYAQAPRTTLRYGTETGPSHPMPSEPESRYSAPKPEATRAEGGARPRYGDDKETD